MKVNPFWFGFWLIFTIKFSYAQSVSPLFSWEWWVAGVLMGLSVAGVVICLKRAR